MTSKCPELFDFVDDTYPPEIRAMMGVYVMYWKLDEFFEQFDVEPPLGKQERHMLIRLDSPKRMGILAEQMAALPSTVTATADALEERGLVLRERDPQDRRAWRVCLTEAGDVVRRDFIDAAGAAFERLSGLDQTEINRLAELVSKASINILKDGLPEGMKSESF